MNDLKFDLNKCCDCQREFRKGQEYYEIYRKEKMIMWCCLNCYELYTDKKKQ
jgi:hypothetical protein